MSFHSSFTGSLGDWSLRFTFSSSFLLLADDAALDENVVDGATLDVDDWEGKVFDEDDVVSSVLDENDVDGRALAVDAAVVGSVDDP